MLNIVQMTVKERFVRISIFFEIQKHRDDSLFLRVGVQQVDLRITSSGKVDDPCEVPVDCAHRQDLAKRDIPPTTRNSKFDIQISRPTTHE